MDIGPIRRQDAAAVLLIARALPPDELELLMRATDLEKVVEVRSEEELERALIAGAEIIGVNSRNLETLAALATGAITPQQIEDLPVAPSYVPFEFAAGSTTPVPVATAAVAGAENVAAANFRQAAEDLFRRFETPIPARPSLEALDFAVLRTKLETALAPPVK